MPAMWAKALAAVLLGLPLSTALIGLLALAWPGRPEIVTLPWLLMVFPLWVGVMSMAFAARTGLRAWLWMGGGTALCHGLLDGLRALGWIGAAAP